MFEFFKKISFFSSKEEMPKNFEEISAYLKKLDKNIERISKDLEALKEESRFSVQKVGIVRFSPFKEVGGDQSFSIALLDANNDGVVITSLYTREGNRVYGKPIQNGRSQYLLSDEEKEAIEKAAGSKISNPNNQ